MKQSRSSIRLFCLFMAAIVTLQIQTSTAQQTVDLTETANQLFEKYDNPYTPGGAAMVIRDGKVVYQHAFGMANLTHNIPFQLHTPTNIGSTSKQFTAFAIAMLEEQGLLSVNDDIRKHIPELPDFGDTVRLRHLLSHTSGYREFINSLLMGGRKLGDIIRLEEIIPIVQNQPALQSPPGESYNYNNTGYVMLALVVERVTGESFPQWMQENIFLPLEMTNTTVRTDRGQIIPGNSQGYIKNSDDEFVEVMDIPASMGAGGIYSTLPDLQKWINHFSEPKIGNAAIMQRITTPFQLNSGDTMSYAYGLILGKINGLRIIEHGGADAAHRSSFILIPDHNGAVVTQSNNGDFSGQTAIKLAEIFFGDVMPEKKETQEQTPLADGEFVFDPEKFDEFAGRYELVPGFVLEFRREGDKLLTQATGQQAVELFASSDSTFFLTVVEASVTFHRNADGEVDHIILHQNGNHLANRIFEPAWEPSPEDIEMYLGRYFSDELEAFYTIALNEDGKLVVQHRRIDDLPLKAESTDEFSASFPLPRLTFMRDEEGQVTGFKASSGRSVDIIFAKQ